MNRLLRLEVVGTVHVSWFRECEFWVQERRKIPYFSTRLHRSRPYRGRRLVRNAPPSVSALLRRFAPRAAGRLEERVERKVESAERRLVIVDERVGVHGGGDLPARRVEEHDVDPIATRAQINGGGEPLAERLELVDERAAPSA